MKQRTSQDEAARFERYDTLDVLLPGVPRCSCWESNGGPFVTHPAACVCRCHGGELRHG